MTSIDDDGYSPSYIVRQSHNILHLDAGLSPVSHEFAITYNSQWNDYSRSLLPVPIICGTLGLAAIVCLQITLCIRIFCKSCRCLPKIKVGRENEEIMERETLPQFQLLRNLFFCFGIIVILTNQMLLFGNRYLTEGVDTSHNGIDFLHDLTQTLTDQGNILLVDGTILEKNLTAAAETCPLAQDLADNVYLYDGYVSDYLDYVSPIPGRCDDANDGLDTWDYYKNASLWAIYAMFWILVVLFTLGMYCKQKCSLQIGIGVSQFVMMIIYLLVGTLMIGFGDFCMEPLTNVAGLLPRDIYNVTYYYLGCEGVNPISTDLNDAYEFVDQYTIKINDLMKSCIDNQGLEDSLDVLQSINTTLNSISSEIDCPPIQYQLSDVIQTGLCEQGFQGLYTIWLGQYISVSCLLVATIFISLIYQYFGQYWSGDVERTNDELDDPTLFVEDVQMTNKPVETPNEFYYSTSSLHQDRPPVADQ